MSRDQQRQWVKHLDIVWDAYALELRQKDKNQNLITKYMVPVDEVVHSDLESEYDEEVADVQTMGIQTHRDNSRHGGVQSM
jgi:hypothetical protein